MEIKTKTDKPTAHITINKSRLKQYEKNSNIPVYYLTKSSEFQIELFNPTKETIMAKISLNGKPIAQGGLVLKPAQRVFLDRYIDVANKFKFNTYEVANTSESRAAIEDNGDFRVEFYREQTFQGYSSGITFTHNDGTWCTGNPIYCTYNADGISNDTITLNLTNISNTSTNTSASSSKMSPLHDGAVYMGWMDQEVLRSVEPINPTKELKGKGKIKLKSRNKIETGRVEAGSKSDQTLTTVYKNWEYTPFHTIEYKMLPVSQKINTVADISIKRYCTNCGNKQKPNFKFCPSCGTQV